MVSSGVEERIGPRHLTSDGSSAMVEVLREVPNGELSVERLANNAPEPYEFAGDLMKALVTGGWTIKSVADFSIGAGPVPRGCTIGVFEAAKPPKRAAVLQRALRAAGVDATFVEPYGSLDGVVLIVGAHP
jgi:hypothetical protein